VSLGLIIAAVEILPLAFYLAKSPVWSDRERVRPSPWTITRPRVLDSLCTALPYAFGSQRRGHPHLGRAFGVHNLNESAGGYTGLATLIWLAPVALRIRRREPRVLFLAALGLVGALGAFGLPPVENVLRMVPVLNVTDNRRLSLWLAFSLVLLGGMGLDHLAASPRSWAAPRAWAALALVLFACATVVVFLEPTLRSRALEHYVRAAAASAGTTSGLASARAEQQVRLTLTFVPRYLTLSAGYLLVLATLAEGFRRGVIPARAVRSGLVGLSLVELLGFGAGLNPAIDRRDDRVESPLIAALRREASPPARIIGVGAELPPNTLMRYGLRDVRNYDSVELSRNLKWLAPLYEPGAAARTSRRDITWAGVIRARDRLREASVRAIVGASPPPEGAFERVERVGAVWVAYLNGKPWAGTESGTAVAHNAGPSGEIELEVDSPHPERVIIRETFDPGWRATLDGRPIDIDSYMDTFQSVRVPPGRHRLALRYDPIEVRFALGASIFGLSFAFFALTGSRLFRSTRIIARGLGRSQAAELESVLSSFPAKHRGMRR
jgi:hypothetical protein